MSSRLAKQSLELLTASSKKSNNADNNNTNKKIKLPKVNRGIKKVKYEMRYGVHKKTRMMQEEKRKRENPVGKKVKNSVITKLTSINYLDRLNEEELSKEEQLKRNVQIMRKALRSSQLEKDVHKEVIHTCLNIWKKS